MYWQIYTYKGVYEELAYVIVRAGKSKTCGVGQQVGNS